MTSTEDRLSALEAAVAHVTALVESASPADPPAPSKRSELWLLEELLERHPEGALTYGGHADLAGGPVSWQMGASPADLLESDWHDPAGRLAALAHPVRLRLLQLVLSGVTSTAQLAADDDLGTTGQLHHHLRQLVAAGWLSSAGRGRYAVPAPRVIPLLLIVSAAEA